jgi:hypothetical protein
LTGSPSLDLGVGIKNPERDHRRQLSARILTLVTGLGISRLVCWRELMRGGGDAAPGGDPIAALVHRAGLRKTSRNLSRDFATFSRTELSCAAESCEELACIAGD